jgi:hypothetical protein
LLSKKTRLLIDKKYSKIPDSSHHHHQIQIQKTKSQIYKPKLQISYKSGFAFVSNPDLNQTQHRSKNANQYLSQIGFFGFDRGPFSVKTVEEESKNNSNSSLYVMCKISVFFRYNTYMFFFQPPSPTTTIKPMRRRHQPINFQMNKEQ